MKVIQKQWIYAQRPDKAVSQQHYHYRENELTVQLSNNEVLVEARYISVDPYMRIQQSAKDSWEAPHPLNTVQGAAVVSQVIESQHPGFTPGNWVLGYTGWQSHAIVHGNELQLLDPDDAAVETALGVLGMPGRTAWFGLMEAGKPKPGDTLVVSGAAGAVGSLVCQFGLLAGCTVIGIAGSDEKCQWLTNLGVQHTLNYQKFSSDEALAKQLGELGGVDVYFDNVGGFITDAVMDSLNLRARIVICGQISQYSGGLDHPAQGPRFLHQMLYKRATIQGILARDFTHRMPEMLSAVAPMLKTGKIQFKTTQFNGFESLPDALSALFEGKNLGKMIVRV